jgi:hypothetical protein
VRRTKQMKHNAKAEELSKFHLNRETSFVNETNGKEYDVQESVGLLDNVQSPLLISKDV